MPFSYRHPRPALTVDCAVFGRDEEGVKVLLIERASEPFKGRWALPGGFVDADESVADAAHRELEEETGLTGLALEQLYTFSAPGRDPRGWTVSVAHVAFVTIPECPVQAADDAADAAWFPINELPELAFDHADILIRAREWLHDRIR